MASNRTIKVIRNIRFTFTNQVLVIALSFISRTVFINALGVAYLGISGLFADILGLLSMADLGISTAMGYSFYKPLAENDNTKMAALITFYKKIYNVIALTVAICGFAMVPFLRNIINLERDIPNLEIYYILSVINIVVSYLCVYKTSVIVADQNNYIITRILMIINISKTVIQIISLTIFKSYMVYLFIEVIASATNNILASKKAEKLYPFINERIALPKAEKKDIVENIKSMVIFKFAAVMLNATDNILISTIIGTVAVGYYSNYLMVMNKISAFYSLIFSTMVASIGNLIVKESEEKRYEIFQCEVSLSFLISGVVIPCYTILINDLIGVWLGKSYVYGWQVVLAVGFNMYIYCVLQPVWSYREATGIFKKIKWIMVVCALLNIVLSIVLGNIIGVAGIVFASGISRVMTSFWIEPILLYKGYFGKTVKKYFADVFVNFVMISFLVAMLSYVGALFKVVDWMTLIVKSVIIFVCCFVTTLIVYRKSEGVTLLINKIKKLKKYSI